MAALFPGAERAVHDAALLLQQAWLTEALSGHYRFTQGRYADGLMRPDSLVWPEGGDALAAVVRNTAQGAWWIERGTRAYHWPSAIRWGTTPKVRYTQAGRPYLTVPLRQARGGAPSAGTPPRRGGQVVFRRVTPVSPGWHMPARPPQPVSADVVRAMTPVLTARLLAAVEQDVRVLAQRILV